LPKFAVFFVSCTGLSLLIFIVGLRPFGSQMIAAHLGGLGKGAPGDYIKAWSVLPIRRESVLRGLYVYTFMVASVAMLLAMGVLFYYGLQRTGEFGLVDHKGRPITWLVLPLLFNIPCLAGLVVASSVGDRRLVILSGIVLFLIPTANAISHVLLKITHQPIWLAACIAMAISLVGSLPPLRYLRTLPRQA